MRGVGGGVRPQQRLHPLGDARRQVLELPVEVDAGGLIEAPMVRAVQRLRQPDRIGHRHQHDFSGDGAAVLQVVQQSLQMMRHQHRGHFVRMQRGLQIDLATAQPLTEVQAGDPTLRASRRSREFMFPDFHAQGLGLGEPVSDVVGAEAGDNAGSAAGVGAVTRV